MLAATGEKMEIHGKTIESFLIRVKRSTSIVATNARYTNTRLHIDDAEICNEMTERAVPESTSNEAKAPRTSADCLYV